LVLPGPQPLIKTLIRLADVQGWNLSVVVGSQEEQNLYKNMSSNNDHVFLSDDLDNILAVFPDAPGRGACIVIGHDFSSLSQEVWRNLTNGSRFFLFMSGRTKLGVAPDIFPFTEGASFVPLRQQKLDIRILKQSLEIAKAMHSSDVEGWARRLYKIIDVGDLTTAELGELLVTKFNYGTSLVKVGFAVQNNQ
jgi:hypothetical protein